MGKKDYEPENGGQSDVSHLLINQCHPSSFSAHRTTWDCCAAYAGASDSLLDPTSDYAAVVQSVIEEMIKARYVVRVVAFDLSTPTETRRPKDKGKGADKGTGRAGDGATSKEPATRKRKPRDVPDKV